MADESPLAGLLDRAAHVLNLVGELADAIRANEHSPGDETQRRVSAAWKALLPAIVEAGESLPTDPNPVADWIREVGRVAKWFDGAVRQHGLADVLFRFNCDGFVRVASEGQTLFQQVTAKRDPFAFVDAPVLSLLDRFPATPAGHVAFLEFVRDEVHYAADAKRQQLERGYPNATIESMVRGIYWAEAGARLAALVDLPDEVKAIAGDVLRRELTTGTVEQIDGLLRPAVFAVRDAWERARIGVLANKVAIVNTAGDLWKALSEGQQPCVTTSSISFRPGANTPIVTFPESADDAKRRTLDRAMAMVRAEGGDEAAAMKKLIARVQLQTESDWASVVNLPLAEFVAAATGSKSDGNPGAVKAGEAFRRMMEADPETRDGVEHAKEQLQAFADAMQAAMESTEYKAFQEADRRRWQELANAIAAAKQAAGDELTARHFARPESIEDWEHLARIVEIPAETIRAGNLTAREISACALAWADRQTIKAKLTDDANAGNASEPNVSHDAPPQTDGADANSAFLDEWTGEIVAATAVVVGKKNNAALSRLIDIAKSKEPAGRRLYMMEKTGLLRADVSASELAKLLRVTPAAVKKTRWWKTRMAQRRSENADANAPYHQRRRPGQRGRRR